MLSPKLRPKTQTQKSVAFHTLAFCPWHYELRPVQLDPFNRVILRAVALVHFLGLNLGISPERCYFNIWQAHCVVTNHAAEADTDNTCFVD